MVEGKREKRVKLINKITALVLSLVLVGSLVYFNFIYDDGTSEPPVKDEEQTENVPVGSEVGEKCPAYSLELVDGSGKINIRDLEGKIVIINFWGTWCGPCKQELPDFDQVANEYDGEVIVLTVHSVTGKSDAPAYISEHFPDSKMLFAYDLPLSEYVDMYFNLLGGKSSYPRTLILDQKGVIVLEQDGKLSHSQLVATIEEIKNK